MTRATLHFTRGTDRRQTWGRKDEEYIADFILVSRRTLAPDEYKIFNYHFLLGADWNLCCRRLGMTRGNFFHAVYRIEKKLGRVFRELEPYGLFPIDQYFSTVVNTAAPAEMPRRGHAGPKGPVRPPVRRAA